MSKKSFQPRTTSRSGFTLIELLVVIAIIGILSSIILASLFTARQRARDARRLADVKQIQVALEVYFDTNGSYAPNTAALAFSPFYLPAVPADPNGFAYQYVVLNNSGTLCVGAPVTKCLMYHLGTSLEVAPSQPLNGDADVCLTPPGAGCARQLSGTTISGDDTNSCGAPDPAGRHCYDVIP